MATPANKPMPGPDGISAVGITWYRPETYQRCLAIFEDSSELPDTFLEWRVRAEEAEKERMSLGLKVVRVEIDPVTFPRWCADHGYPNVDTHARMAFASMMAMRSL